MATAVGKQPRRAVGLIARLRAGDASHHSFDGEESQGHRVTSLSFKISQCSRFCEAHTVEIWKLSACSSFVAPSGRKHTLLALKMYNSNCTNSIVTASQGKQTYHYREDTRMERHSIDRCELLSIRGDNEIPHLWAVTQTLSDVQYICALNFF